MFTLNRTAKCQVSVKDKGKYLAECGERQNGQGDLTITVGSRSTKVHRSILMDSSDYFKTMFTGGFSETDATTLDLSNIFEDLDELKAVLDYLYTGSMSLSEENITSVTNSACFLLLADLQDVCSDFLTANLSPSTCINIFVLSERHNMDKLQGACLEVIKAWLPFGLCHSPEALDLSPSCLCVLVKAGVLAMLSNDMKSIYLQKWHKHFTETSSGSTVLPREIEELIQPKLEEKDQLKEETRGSAKSNNEEETEAVLYALLTSGSAKTDHCATEVHAFAPRTKMCKSIFTHKFSRVVKPDAVPTLIGLNDEMAFFMFTKEDINNPEECIIVVDLASNEESVIKPRNDFFITRLGGYYGDEPYYFMWGGQLHAMILTKSAHCIFEKWHLYRNEHKTKCFKTCEGKCWNGIYQFPNAKCCAVFLTKPFQGDLYLWVKERRVSESSLASTNYSLMKVSEPREKSKFETSNLALLHEEDYVFEWGYSKLCNIVSDSETGTLTFTHKMDDSEERFEYKQDAWQEEHTYGVVTYDVTEDKWSDENIFTIRYPQMPHALERAVPGEYGTKLPIMAPCKRLVKRDPNDPDGTYHDSDEGWTAPRPYSSCTDDDSNTSSDVSVKDSGLATCIGTEYFSRTISAYNSPVWKLNIDESKWDLVTYLPHSLSKFQYFQFGELSSGHLKSLPDSQFEDFSTRIGQSAVVHSVFSEKLLSSEEYAEEWAKLWQDKLKGN